MTIINHNVPALNAKNRLTFNTANTSKSLEKLSSGLRINRAGDDAAGLAISEKMRGQIRGLDQAGRNAQDTISLIQTAEGGLNETHSILQRMRELAVQSANDTNTDADRKAIQAEINNLTAEVDRIANTTEFNTKKLLNGDIKGAADAASGTYSITNNSGATLTVTNSSDIFNQAKVTGAYTIIRLDGAQSNGGFTGTGASFAVYDVNGTRMTGTSVSYTGSKFTFATAAGVTSSKNIVTGVASTTKAITFSVDSMTKFKAGDTFTFTIGAATASQKATSTSITTLIGANSGQTLEIGINSMKASALGLRGTGGASTISVSTKFTANAAVAKINAAIEQVSLQRSKMGGLQNRLEHTINNLSTSSENLTAAESRIRDVDMAKEMMEFSKNNILVQASQAMLSQANQQPQGVLQLLR